MKNTLLACICFLLISNPVSARILGGEMWYEQTDANQYTIHLTWYREYEPEFEPVFWLGIYHNTDYELYDTVAAVEIGRGIIESGYPTCVGVVRKYEIEKLEFATEVFLPDDPEGYLVEIMGNTRTEWIDNIFLPGLRGLTLFTTIPGEVVNTAPHFIDAPIWYACEDQPLNVSLGATEPDGDEITYALVPALNADHTEGFFQSLPSPPPFSELTYLGGNDALHPFPSATDINLDAETGQFTALPTEEGVYVVTVELTETRLGVEMSKVRRDIILIVENCDFTTAVVDLGPDIYQCNDTHVYFDFDIEGWAGYYWELGDGTTSTYMMYDHNYPVLGDYQITYIANKDLPCADTFYLDVHLKPLATEVLEADLTGNPENCFYDTIQLNGEPGFTTQWVDLNTGSILGTGSPLDISHYNYDFLATAFYYDDAFCYASDTVGTFFYPDNTPIVILNQDNPQWFLYCNNAFDPYVTSIQWYKDGAILPGETSPNLPLTSCGSYYAEMIDTHDCIFTSAPTVYCNSQIGDDPASNISIGPNPTNGIFTINMPAHQYTTLQIYSAVGELIYSMEMLDQPDQITIPLEAASGLYQVALQNEHELVTLPLVVK